VWPLATIVAGAAIPGDGWMRRLTPPSEGPRWLRFIEDERATHGQSKTSELLMILEDALLEDRLSWNRTKTPSTRREAALFRKRFGIAVATSAMLQRPPGPRACAGLEISL
jgi:hypothetical protein